MVAIKALTMPAFPLRALWARRKRERSFAPCRTRIWEASGQELCYRPGRLELLERTHQPMHVRTTCNRGPRRGSPDGVVVCGWVSVWVNAFGLSPRPAHRCCGGVLCGAGVPTYGLIHLRLVSGRTRPPSFVCRVLV